MYIHDVGYTWYIHGYTTYIPCILVRTAYAWNICGTYQAYTENRCSRCSNPVCWCNYMLLHAIKMMALIISKVGSAYSAYWKCRLHILHIVHIILHILHIACNIEQYHENLHIACIFCKFFAYFFCIFCILIMILIAYCAYFTY